MSRAFIKEDVDPPERSGRARTTSGLPPGAANYITARGANQLGAKLNELRRQATEDDSRIKDLQELLTSVTIVQVPEDQQQIIFGAKVKVRGSGGELQSYHIVGVDELDLYPDAVSWISPLGKALLAAELRDRITLPSGERVEVVAVDYPNE